MRRTKNEAVSKRKAQLEEDVCSQGTKHTAQHNDQKKSGHVWIPQAACKHQYGLQHLCDFHGNCMIARTFIWGLHL